MVALPWSMMFVYDSAICCADKVLVKEELDRWRHAFKRRLRLSRSKTVPMHK